MLLIKDVFLMTNMLVLVISCFWRENVSADDHIVCIRSFERTSPQILLSITT